MTNRFEVVNINNPPFGKDGETQFQVLVSDEHEHVSDEEAQALIAEVGIISRDKPEVILICDECRNRFKAVLQTEIDTQANQDTKVALESVMRFDVDNRVGRKSYLLGKHTLLQEGLNLSDRKALYERLNRVNGVLLEQEAPGKYEMIVYNAIDKFLRAHLQPEMYRIIGDDQITFDRDKGPETANEDSK